MCLIVFAWQSHPSQTLVLAANRDEFHRRPTLSARFWSDAPGVLAGRDLQAGGTWLGVSRTGAFAAVTNFRERRSPPSRVVSRGRLVSDYLLSGERPERWLRGLETRAGSYAGFNMLAGTPGELCYYSNRGGEVRTLPPGVYGLSNHLLDTDWPKVARARRGLADRLEVDRLSVGALFELMADRGVPPDDELPDTGVGLEAERRLGPAFISGPGYGTRCTTVLTIDRANRLSFTERTTAPVPGLIASYRFGLPRPPLRSGGSVQSKANPG